RGKRPELLAAAAPAPGAVLAVSVCRNSWSAGSKLPDAPEPAAAVATAGDLVGAVLAAAAAAPAAESEQGEGGGGFCGLTGDSLLAAAIRCSAIFRRLRSSASSANRSARSSSSLSRFTSSTEGAAAAATTPAGPAGSGL